MDPYSSPYTNSKNNPHDPFLYSLTCNQIPCLPLKSWDFQPKALKVCSDFISHSTSQQGAQVMNLANAWGSDYT